MIFFMNAPSSHQYKLAIRWKLRIPITGSGEKYERYLKFAQVINSIFIADVWKDWDDHLEHLVNYHKDPNQNQNLPPWLEISWDPRIVSPRTTTFLIICLIHFWEYHARKYTEENKNIIDYSEIEDIVGWWANACETGRHSFWNFKIFLGRGIPEPHELDIVEILQITRSSAMLDTHTFNRFSLRNYIRWDDWYLEHNYNGHTPEYIPAERVGCPAVRRYLWVNWDFTIFDELFARICAIYGYNPIQNIRETVSQSTVQLCPHRK